jgi:proteasome lid subunit RPN8/RPN11
MGRQRWVENLLSMLWPVRHLAGPPHVEHSVLEGEPDIAVIEVQSLYTDPECIDPNEFSATAEHLFAFGMDGPVIAVTHSALDAAVCQADAHPDVEVGGICLGFVFQSLEDSRLLVRVEEVIKAEHTVAGGAYLTFTHETWQKLIDVHWHDFPDMRVVGWYHSHPGFGVFLSSMDRFIHDNFFAASWNVAVVIDPLQKQVGVFARHAERLLPPKVFGWTDDVRSIGQLPPISTNSDLMEQL